MYKLTQFAQHPIRQSTTPLRPQYVFIVSRNTKTCPLNWSISIIFIWQKHYVCFYDIIQAALHVPAFGVWINQQPLLFQYRNQSDRCLNWCQRVMGLLLQTDQTYSNVIPSSPHIRCEHLKLLSQGDSKNLSWYPTVHCQQRCWQILSASIITISDPEQECIYGIFQ